MDIKDSVIYIPDFLDKYQADWLFNYAQKLEWRSNQIKLHGKTFDVPRLETYYGNPKTEYLYSKSVLLKPLPWTKPLDRLRICIERKLLEYAWALEFHAVLGNRYRTGSDSISYHNDNEVSMGLKPAIASVSVGAVRRFKLKHNITKEVYDFDLAHGSLLVMLPGCQEFWTHSVPKTKKPVGERINFTFRPHKNYQK